MSLNKQTYKLLDFVATSRVHLGKNLKAGLAALSKAVQKALA